MNESEKLVRGLEPQGRPSASSKYAEASDFATEELSLPDDLSPGSAADVDLPTAGMDSGEQPDAGAYSELLDSLQVDQTRAAHIVATLPRAAEVKTFLDTRVIGQSDAKLLLAVLFSMHIHRQPAESSAQRPPNAIIVGPTGVGKTHTLRVASELLQVPFLTVDSTTLVPSGGRGIQIGNVVEDLIALAHSLFEQHPDLRTRYASPKHLAQKGVVFFDEFDKVAVFSKDGTTGTNTLDAWNLSVQRTLLKFCEGSLVGIGVRDSNEFRSSPTETLDTSGILVLAGGAFQGISDSKIRSKRPEALQREIRQQTSVISNDFVAFGIMPELVARLQVLVEFKGLSTEDLQKILENPHTSPIQVWVKHFGGLGKKLRFTEAAMKFVAGRASLLDLGARGLHQILFPALAKMTYGMETSESNEIEIGADSLRLWLNQVGY